VGQEKGSRERRRVKKPMSDRERIVFRILKSFRDLAGITERKT